MYKKKYIAIKFAPPEPGGSDVFALLFPSCSTLELGMFFVHRWLKTSLKTHAYFKA